MFSRRQEEVLACKHQTLSLYPECLAAMILQTYMNTCMYIQACMYNQYRHTALYEYLIAIITNRY